jgi:hypothetical protein
MAATLELKYYNSFWLKKMDTIVDVAPSPSITSGVTSIGATSIVLDDANAAIMPGQSVTWENSTLDMVTNNVVSVSNDNLTVYLAEPIIEAIPNGTTIQFGPISDFTYIPYAYDDTEASDWFLEEARIRGGYNNTLTDLGVKAHIVEDITSQQHRFNSLIYSGVFNSRTGVNKTNEFSVGEDITRAVDPSNGSIQKLYSENTNLTIFQENKVSQALIDKDAIYSAEGQPITTSGRQVIGQVQAYGGNYGISTNPESFAVYGYRKYFVDKNQNAVLRLSQDGITEISAYGMLDYFRDTLGSVGTTGKIIGGWDMHSKQYVVSIQPTGVSSYNTLAFDENAQGWVSKFSYKPDFIASLRNNMYTFYQGNVWKHYSTNVNKGTFYTIGNNSYVTLAINPDPSISKSFNTINYEGSAGWDVTSIQTNSDTGLGIGAFSQPLTLAELESQLLVNSFKKKENKYFASINNSTSATPGEIIYGQSISGIKGYYATVSLSINNGTYGAPTLSNIELFAVSLGYQNLTY